MLISVNKLLIPVGFDSIIYFTHLIKEELQWKSTKKQGFPQKLRKTDSAIGNEFTCFFAFIFLCLFYKSDEYFWPWSFHFKINQIFQLFTSSISHHEFLSKTPFFLQCPSAAAADSLFSETVLPGLRSSGRWHLRPDFDPSIPESSCRCGHCRWHTDFP